MKTLKELAEQNEFSRNDLLIIFAHLVLRIDQPACSRLWDMQVELGFDRDEEYGPH